MPHRRRWIPLLTAVLVIQSLVAVLPHTHSSAVDGQVWQASSHIDSTHHCFACSAHSPVVEPAAEIGDAAGTTILSPIWVCCGSGDVLSILSSASPRGPPRIV